MLIQLLLDQEYYFLPSAAAAAVTQIIQLTEIQLQQFVANKTKSNNRKEKKLCLLSKHVTHRIYS